MQVSRTLQVLLSLLGENKATMTDLRPTILGLGISMPVLAIIAVILRCQARMVKKVRLEADDYTIFIALVRSFQEHLYLLNNYYILMHVLG